MSVQKQRPPGASPVGVRKGAYFEGWYLRQQNARETVALIPAYHCGADGVAAASLQVITDEAAYCLPFAATDFAVDRAGLSLRLGGNLFSAAGCSLACAGAGLRLRGALRFRALTPPDGDIMGPFRFLPGMQCYHSLFSLRHYVDGCLTLNGRDYRFRNDAGYWEGDRGVSFPRRYLWTHGAWQDNSIMLSVAEIPYAGLRFTGCIAAVLYRGREYRLATYRGARVVAADADSVALCQGGLRLEARLLAGAPLPLAAPERGAMRRVIEESAACAVRYRLWQRGETVFDVVCSRAGFESEWQPRP